MLISRSCTTGWSDWIHGELWLTRTALIRSRLSFAETLANNSSTSVAEPAGWSDLPEHLRPERVRAGHRTNRYLPLAEMTEARLERGRLTDRLHVTLSGRTRQTLLWFATDPASGVLDRALRDALGGRYDSDER